MADRRIRPDELRNLMTRAFFGQDYDIDERTRITWTSHMEGDIEE